MSDWFQWAVIAFIVLGISWAVWRGGANNPVSTGTLEKNVSDLSSDVKSLGGRVGRVESNMKELEGKAASTADIADLEKVINARLETLDTKINGHRDLSQMTNDSVRRIEKIVLEKGFRK